jgi:hypothetical protein
VCRERAVERLNLLTLKQKRRLFLTLAREVIYLKQDCAGALKRPRGGAQSSDQRGRAPIKGVLKGGPAPRALDHKLTIGEGGAWWGLSTDKVRRDHLYIGESFT